MKRTIILLMAIVNGAWAVDGPGIIRQSSSMNIMPLYQRWTVKGGESFAEFSTPVFVYLALSPYMSLGLRGSQANADGDKRQELSGFTDTQIDFNYHLEQLNLILTLGLNLPSGKKELTPAEFATSSLLGLNFYNFQVPNFGQGLNVSPGFSWAWPVHENVVIGLGASYQYKGQFKPLANMAVNYDPGDEILLTGGIDLRLPQNMALSADIIFTTYGTDKRGAKPVFAAGDRAVTTAQFRYYFQYNELWFVARYRSKTKNSLVVGGELVPEKKKTTPDHLEVLGLFRRRFSEKFYNGFLVEGRFYERTAAYAALNIFGAGLAPEILLSSNLKIPLRFKYLLGKQKGGPDILGIEAGAGLGWTF
jgi:hypothetical protein